MKEPELKRSGSKPRRLHAKLPRYLQISWLCTFRMSSCHRTRKRRLWHMLWHSILGYECIHWAACHT